MRAFVAMRNYITTTTQITAELSEIRAKLALLERADEDNAEAVNDLSEDMRKELTTFIRLSRRYRSRCRRLARSASRSDSSDPIQRKNNKICQVLNVV